MIYEIWLANGRHRELQWRTTNLFEADILFNYGRAVAKESNLDCVLTSREATYGEMAKKTSSMD